MSMPQLSIVIPAYNEAACLARTVNELVATMASQPWTYEVIIVDDGSSDCTLAVAEGLAELHAGVRVIPGEPNRGQGYAVRVGMLAARGALRVMLDADGATPASELVRLVVARAEGHADVAIGSRLAPPAGWRRVRGRGGRQTLVPGVRDAHLGFKLFTAQAACDLFGRATVDGWAFDLEILGMARRLGYEIVEVGVAWDPEARAAGTAATAEVHLAS